MSFRPPFDVPVQIVVAHPGFCFVSRVFVATSVWPGFLGAARSVDSDIRSCFAPSLTSYVGYFDYEDGVWAHEERLSVEVDASKRLFVTRDEATMRSKTGDEWYLDRSNLVLYFSTVPQPHGFFPTGKTYT